MKRIAIGCFVMILMGGLCNRLARAEDVSGIYEGKGIILTIQADENDADGYSGTIKLDDNEFPFHGKNTVKGFNGEFTDDNESYAFSVYFHDDGSAQLESDGTTYDLKQTKSASPPKKDNPLKKKKKDGGGDKPPVPPQEGEGGLGIAFEINDDGDYVVNDLMENGPAARAGVEKGDILVSVDGRRVKNLTKNQVAALTRGQIGSKVTLVINRGDGNTVTLTFERGSLDPEGIKKDMEKEAREDAEEEKEDNADDGDPPDRPAADIKMVEHPSGLATVGQPAGWKKDQENELVIKFVDPKTGVLVEYIHLKGAGFQTSKEFYEKGLKPGLVDNQAKIGKEDDFEIDGIAGYASMYEGKGDKLGIFVMVMLSPGGDGFIFHFEGTEEQIEANKMEDLMLSLAHAVKFKKAAGNDEGGAGRDDRRERPRDDPEARRDDDAPAAELVHPERAPEGWQILKSPRDTDGRVLAASGLRGRDSVEMLNAASDALGRYFDGRPQFTNGFVDADSGVAQALFHALLGKQVVRGHVVAAPDGHVGVVYDAADRFDKSFKPLAQAMLDQVPELMQQTINFVDARLPDNSGSMKIPDGWKITDSYQGCVSVSGPNGEGMILGQSMQIMTGIDPMGIAPPMQSPYYAPIPRNIGEAIQNAMNVQNNLQLANGGKTKCELVRIIESTPFELGQNFTSALVLADIRYLTEGQEPIPARVYGLVSYAPIDAGQWMYYQSILGAPPKRFPIALPTMIKTWQTWKVDEKVLFDRIVKANEAMRETTQIILEVTHNRQQAFEKGLAPFSQYIRGSSSVVDSRTGKVIEKPNTINRDDPNEVDPRTGQPRDPNQNITDWIKDENDKAGYERFKQIDPNDPRVKE